MSKEHIFAVVKKHLRQAVDGLADEQIELGKSMKELGANSLDMVEVVSATMRELKIRIPRSELSKLTNIGGLVDLLGHAATATAGEPGPPTADQAARSR